MTTPPVIDYEGSDYQQSFWEEGGRAYEDAAEAFALKRLLPNAGQHLLELGAGAGRNTPRYENYRKITLLDYSLTQLQQAVQRLGTSERYTFIAADIYRLPFVAGAFDGATMIRTLHHMTDPALALSQVRRVLQPNACFILEYANKRNLKAMLRYLFKKQSWNPYSPEQVEFEALNFDFHPRTVAATLKQTGFCTLKELSVSHFRIGALKRRIPPQTLARWDNFLQPNGAWLKVTPSIFTLNQAIGDSPIAPAGSFFQCPACGGPMEENDNRMLCSACGKIYPKLNGIYDFRLPS